MSGRSVIKPLPSTGPTVFVLQSRAMPLLGQVYCKNEGVNAITIEPTHLLIQEQNACLAVSSGSGAAPKLTECLLGAKSLKRYLLRALQACVHCVPLQMGSKSCLASVPSLPSINRFAHCDRSTMAT